MPIRLMNRKRYVWAIGCEEFPETSSKKFYDAVYDLRYYFYSAAE